MIYDQGIQPRSIKIIKVSNFDRPAELGELTFTALRSRIYLHRLVVVGIQTAPQAEVAEAFLQSLGYGVWKLDGPEAMTEILNRLRAGQKISVVTTPNEAIHFHKQSKVLELEKESRLEALSFAFVHLPNSKGTDLYEACERKGKFTHTIGCLLEDKVKIFKGGRSQPNWAKFVGAMEQEGQRTYMVYQYYP